MCVYLCVCVCVCVCMCMFVAIHIISYNYMYSIHFSKSSADVVSKSTGCKEPYCFMLLPHHNRTTQVFPDTMHTVKDCIERIFFLITGKTNHEPIIQSESSIGRFSINHKRKRTSKSKKVVELPYVLNAEEIKLADK